MQFVSGGSASYGTTTGKGQKRKPKEVKKIFLLKMLLFSYFI